MRHAEKRFPEAPAGVPETGPFGSNTIPDHTKRHETTTLGSFVLISWIVSTALASQTMTPFGVADAV
jgi:hypothetical protein